MRYGQYPKLANAPDPCQGVRLPAAQNERIRYFTPDELERMKKVALQMENGETLWQVTEFALNTGLRRLEQFSLRVGDYDANAGSLRVVRTKTDKPRPIPLNATARHIADSWAHIWEPVAGTSEEEGTPRAPGEWLFLPAWGDDRLRAGELYVSTFWRVVVAAANVSDALFRDCHHHFASMLAMQNESLYVIGNLLGHSGRSIGMTARYAHLSMEKLQSAVDRIG